MIQVLRETHETPSDIARILRQGGLNPYGEPNYRAVWGANRLDWIGGLWADYDASGNKTRERFEIRRVPKYREDRWHFERWMPPESYGPRALWEMQTFETQGGVTVAALGPYPSRGDWELAFTLEDSLGQFVQLTPMIARAFVAALETSREAPKMTRTEFISRSAAKQEREYDNYADSVLNDGSTISGPMVAVP